MYEQNKNAVNSQAEKKPYHIEIADKVFETLMEMPHQEQVEAFRYLQEKIKMARLSQNEQMQKELEDHSTDVKRHSEGTNIIASAL